jgi:hypothetical protein
MAQVIAGPSWSNAIAGVTPFCSVASGERLHIAMDGPFGRPATELWSSVRGQLLVQPVPLDVATV